MNARQMKKNLKKQIRELQLDNNLMRGIIDDSPGMRELYDLYNKPLNVCHTTTEVQEVKAQRVIPTYLAGDEFDIEWTKNVVKHDLLDIVEDCITYEVDTDGFRPTVTASVFVGRK